MTLEVSPPKPSPIRLLPAEIIHRIAAGEIVDRPASVLKELLENSIDAGAKNLRIMLVDGGQTLIEVLDDGRGLSQDDLEVCVQRHATSKISKLEDLEHIASLGFRGEALAATASVSRLLIETYREGSGAWSLEVIGGKRQALQPSNIKTGTRIQVKNLFFNVPARLKFLKKTSGEVGECIDVLESTALCNPRISIEWNVVNSEGELKTQKKLSAESLESRFRNISGTAGELIHARKENCARGIESLELFVFKPPTTSPYQKHIRLVVNGRPVYDKRLPYALRDSFSGLIEVGQFPIALILFKVDPGTIDVNIHPQKKEIRWPQGFSPAGLVYSLVRDELSKMQGPAPAAMSFEPERQFPLLNAEGPVGSEISLPEMPSVRPPPNVPFQHLVSRMEMATPESVERAPFFKFSALRVVGEVGAAWLVCESEQGLVLIDQHAAHERINFDRILKKSNLIRSKPLLLPIEIDIPLVLEDSMEQLLNTMQEFGFDIDTETAKKNTLEILAIPEADRALDWAKLLKKIFYGLESEGDSMSVLNSLRVKLAASLSCHGSVRRGQRLNHEQIKSLLVDMDKIAWGGLCPHGRPVWIFFSHESIETLFHRA